MVQFIFFSDGCEEKKNKKSFVFSLLIVIGLIVLVIILPNVYAQELELIPEPEQTDNSKINSTSCGEGTTFTDGICIVNHPAPVDNTHGKWGDPYTISKPIENDGIGEWTGTPSPHVWDTGDGIGAGSLDLDSDLSPSYAYDFMGGYMGIIFYHTILPLVGLGLGISALFLVPHFILKRKNIPSKPYLSLILAGLLLYFFIPNFVASLHLFTILFSHPDQILTWVFNFRFILLLIPIFVIVIAGIILYRSSVIRKLLKK